MSKIQKLQAYSIIITAIVLLLVGYLFYVPEAVEDEFNLGEYHTAILMANKYKEQADSFQNLYLNTDYGKDTIIYRTKKIFISSQYLPADSTIKFLSKIFAEVDSLRQRYERDSAIGSRW